MIVNEILQAVLRRYLDGISAAINTRHIKFFLPIQGGALT